MRKLNIPAFRDEIDPADYSASQAIDTAERFTSVVVARWGRVGGFTFRAGDRLVLSEQQEAGTGLLLLRPRGYGWPMLGRLEGCRLVAEPGGVRAAARRWRIAASVVGVERSLGRSVMDQGKWYVAVAARGGTSTEELRLAGLRSGLLTHREVDALCHRAGRFVDQGRGLVAVGVALSESDAQKMVQGCPAGRLRMPPIVIPAESDASAELADVLEGPWAPVDAEQARRVGAMDNGSTETRYDPPAAVDEAEHTATVQLPLFHRSRRNRAS